MHSNTLLLVALAAMTLAQAVDTTSLQQSRAASALNSMPVIRVADEDNVTTQLDSKLAMSTMPLPPIVAPPVMSAMSTLPLPPIVQPPVMRLAAQDQVVMRSHHKREAKLTPPKMTTDLFSETLRNLPKPGPMPTTSVHYDAAWTSSVSSQISEAVRKARAMTSKSPQQKLEDQKKSLVASVTSAEAGLKSASIASSSASSVESAEASAKARESKALKNAQHNLNKWFHKHDKHSATSQASPVVELSAWVSVAVGLVLALSVL